MDGKLGGQLSYSTRPFNFHFAVNKKQEGKFVDEARPYSDGNLLY